MYWILLFIKYLLGLCIGLSAMRVSKKKLPSHDRLTTDKGVEPLTANKNKEFEL
ncbi:hypothetical protein BI000_gp49 [Streptococcus phage 9871]|uniref:Uncharacterized protein n=1 Tax=Streptococcus phage 9871 TaxID=1814957 RepID=A0A191KBE0_9CAUD|nr:hypothetical protein BI000_gp49 [Streptococcus phage 9871]AMQ65743.1 hypothetical protein P9871_49 [Streptococcus phage 9871]